MANYVLTIGGERVSSANTFPVVDPATGGMFAEAPECSKRQLDQAVEAASRAFVSWRRDLEARRIALLRCADVVDARADDFVRVLVAEQGKPLEQARYEVRVAALCFRATAPLSLPDELLKDDEGQRIVLRHKPIGVTAAIPPWNYPLSLAARKIAPALLAGNTVVLKPSPFTPLTSLMLGDALREVLPPGVLNVVAGREPLGTWLTEHPDVRKISFTGSIEVGKRIATTAAADLKRVTLELGGNDPAIVLADVDPASVAEKIFWSAFNNCGQVCIAVKRVYVEEAVYEPLVEAMVEVAQRAVVGNGFDPATQIGPINNRPHYERVLRMIETARIEGGEVRAGGQPLRGCGNFIEPTIVTGLSDGTTLVDQEQFGPVLPIVAVRDVEEALASANATHYGLGGSVWTNDWQRGSVIAGELECGTAWVNRHGMVSQDAPFGGSRWSGLGYAYGRWGLAEFTEMRVVNAAKS